MLVFCLFVEKKGFKKKKYSDSWYNYIFTPLVANKPSQSGLAGIDALLYGFRKREKSSLFVRGIKLSRSLRFIYSVSVKK